MTNVTRVRIFGGVFVLLLAFKTHACTLLGKVINVADGDTITVLDDTNAPHKIRLAGIDAPEKRQAFGNVSKQSLAEQVAGCRSVCDGRVEQG